jgi:hypothetical protein
MPRRFFGKKIDVATSGEVRVPVSFRLEGQEHKIAEVLESWPDYGFGRSVAGRKGWRQRHHRTYYRVKTAEGGVYEIYHDRGTKLSHPELKRWYLSKQL